MTSSVDLRLLWVDSRQTTNFMLQSETGFGELIKFFRGDKTNTHFSDAHLRGLIADTAPRRALCRFFGPLPLQVRREDCIQREGPPHGGLGRAGKGPLCFFGGEDEDQKKKKKAWKDS